MVRLQAGEIWDGRRTKILLAPWQTLVRGAPSDFRPTSYPLRILIPQSPENLKLHKKHLIYCTKPIVMFSGRPEISWNGFMKTWTYIKSIWFTAPNRLSCFQVDLKWFHGNLEVHKKRLVYCTKSIVMFSGRPEMSWNGFRSTWNFLRPS